jgi:hypothetical protein
MKIFSFSYLLILISIIIYSFILSEVKAQEDILPEEKQLLKECLFYWNKTEGFFKEISETLKNVKFNILIRMRYNNLISRNNKIRINIIKIQEKLNSNSYVKYKIMSDLNKLKIDIREYEKNCVKTYRGYIQSQHLKNIILDTIKIALIIIIIVSIIVLAAIGIISLYVIKKQSKYDKLEEEVTLNEDIEVKVKNKNSKLNNEKIALYQTKINKKKKEYKKNKTKKKDNSKN